MKLFKLAETSFKNYDDTVKNYLSKVLGNVGASYSNSHIYSAIYEGIKGVMQNAMFYIEDALTEQNVDTAYRKSSLYSLAKLSGYEPYFGSAAVGLINCMPTLSNGLPNGNTKIYIRNGSAIINNETGINYIVYLPTDYYVIDLSKPLTNNQFKIVQGKWITATYLANGENLETINIHTTGLYDVEYIEVTVDGQKYTQAACLYDMTEDSHEFVATSGYDNELDIMFGNGVYGKKLEEGQAIIIKYISHMGTSGNIAIDDSVDFEFTDSLYDEYGNIINGADYFLISLGSSISGGSDSDTIADIRQMIGYNSRSLVLASENNFKLFLKRFSFIGQSNIWCEENSLVVNATCLADVSDKLTSNSDYFTLQESDLLLTNKQKEMVIDTLENSNKAYAGITLNFIDPIIRKYAIIAYIKIASNYDRDTVKADISNCIADYFINLPANTTFIPKSDIVKKVLDEVDYIESFDIYFISDAEERAYANNYYYTYEHKKVNDEWTYVKVKKIYDSSENIGLDAYGNIELDTKFEIPMIASGVYYNSDKKDSSNTITFDTPIQFLFI